jgi:hypothetical protein
MSRTARPTWRSSSACQTPRQPSRSRGPTSCPSGWSKRLRTTSMLRAARSTFLAATRSSPRRFGSSWNRRDSRNGCVERPSNWAWRWWRVRRKRLRSSGVTKEGPEGWPSGLGRGRSRAASFWLAEITRRSYAIGCVLLFARQTGPGAEANGLPPPHDQSPIPLRAQAAYTMGQKP